MWTLIVVGRSKTRSDAEKVIPSLKDKKVDVVVMDGNLSEGDGRGRDGEYLASNIKGQHGNNIIVVGHALEKSIPSADKNSTKMQGGSHLIKTVSEA